MGFDSLLLEISRQAFEPETLAMQKLLEEAKPISAAYAKDNKFAKSLIKQAAGVEKTAIQGFLESFGLSSKEGIAIMCLAEALIRIPDRQTANALIQGAFQETEWQKYLGHPSLLVNASTWGLMLTGHLMDIETSLLKKMLRRMGEPVIRQALRTAISLIGSQFVLGENVREALEKSKPYLKKGFLFSYDVLGEGARSQEQAEHYYKSYLAAIHEIGVTADEKATIFKRPSLSIKLSALHPRYEWLKRDRVKKELLPKLVKLAKAAAEAGIAIAIDAEETWRLDLSLDLYQALFENASFKSYEGMGFVLQAYQKRAWHVLDFLTSLSKQEKKRIPLRLVKGAYWDGEIKRAQEQGLKNYPVFTRKSYTDTSYLVCAQKILQAGELFYPQFATHNALTIATIQRLAKENKSEFELQKLYGMGQDFYTPLLSEIPCRIYAPIGKHQDLLAYLIRRLLENGASQSFIHILSNREASIKEALADPVAKAASRSIKKQIPLPVDLYGDRKNSLGVDLGNRAEVEALGQPPTPKIKLLPSKPEMALALAEEAFETWSKEPVEMRAAVIEKAADLLEERREEAFALLFDEAKKTLSDAIAEWREAIDFFRYYALHARKLLSPQFLKSPSGEQNSLSLHGRGVFACISPWNFPLAIFTGQVAASLVCGNSVIAKPARQTPKLAQFVVNILHEAGVPKNALHWLDIEGAAMSRLLEDKRFAGVAFTGSTETAHQIARTLAARRAPIAPFIAETGGQNAMIADSSTLIEQLVDDAISSAFLSAGQRCSALRVLYVQEEIADKTLDLLKGALKERTLGPVRDYSTDIGPVIDDKARAGLLKHIEKMKKQAKVIYAAESADGFVAPHIFEIPHISSLGGEVFGPILHVIRYPADGLEDVIAQVNSTGYGLTCGIHTRVGERAEYIRERIHAGNIYVNRSMTGAVVGVQPFGGEGLSGTGFKAGGPHYLLRFCVERTYTVNKAAIGGNLELLL